MQEYDKAIDEMKIEMEKKLSYHEKNPEKHPMYPDEWKKFWNRRFKELQIEGKDPNTYDFKPEWILSWSKRMQEIHDEEINEKIDKLKSKILGDVNMDKSSSESPSRDLSPSKDKKPSMDVKNPWHNNVVPEPVEKDSDIVNRSSNDKKVRVAGASPINSDSEDSMNEINEANKPREKIKIDNPLNVITVLRQLTVLENQLGLLAPKVVDLLSQGLVMEKIEQKSSIKLLNPENCVMFETVKEKLKGQLLAGVVKRSLVNATMFSIRNIEKLMQIAPKFVPPTSMLNSSTVPTLTPTTTPSTPIVVPGIGIIDKMAIAQQITQALLAQGKVDVTQDELETLINAVVGMAQSEDNIQGTKNLLPNINNVDMFKTTFNETNKEEVEKKNLDQLSQGDIINLLKNFRDLTTDEQDGLITYLKDLCNKNPEEVKKFRKYIDMGPSNLKEVVTSMFKDKNDDDEDDDNYELSDFCKAVKEKVSEQKKEDLTKMTVDFEITEEQKKLLSSIQDFLPEIKSDYSLQPSQPINSQMQSTTDQSFYRNHTNEPYNSSYSLDPYSAKQTDINNFVSQPSTSSQFTTAQDHQSTKYNTHEDQPTILYNIPQEQTNSYNMHQEESTKYNLSQEQPNNFNIIPQEQHNFNTSQEQSNDYISQDNSNEYNISLEDSDPYSSNQMDTYNDPYSQNYYQGQQQDTYYPYQQNKAPTTKYSSSRGYYKGGKNAYKGNNTYPDTYENDRNNRFNNRSHNNRFQSRR